VDDWGIDAIYSGTQKCLSAPPGLSPVSFNEAAMDKAKSRAKPSQSWFLDLDLLTGYWGPGAKRAYHHTAPVNDLYALHESLVILQEEGLEAAFARHLRNHQGLVAGLEALGLSMAVAEDIRLPQLNAVNVPEGVDEAALRTALLNDFNLEIGAGLGALAGKTWRIGLMGHASNQRNVLACLTALEAVLARQGAAINNGAALPAAQAAFRAR
jgi:alanine-glyoxylate transaminase/serine-glyoxylate transaminase/serine-pyruvate transaminase